MVKKGKSERYIPIKNYIYAGLIIIAIGLLCWYLLSWHKVKTTEKYLNSYLLSTNTLTLEIKNINETATILQDAPSSYFVYIGYTNDKDEYELETKLKKVIDEYRINYEMYYIDITSIKDDKDLNTRLNKAFNTDQIKNTPCILYFKDTVLTDIIDDKSGIFEVEEFENLLKRNDYMKEAS